MRRGRVVHTGGIDRSQEWQWWRCTSECAVDNEECGQESAYTRCALGLRLGPSVQAWCLAEFEAVG